MAYAGKQDRDGKELGGNEKRRGESAVLIPTARRTCGELSPDVSRSKSNQRNDVNEESKTAYSTTGCFLHRLGTHIVLLCGVQLLGGRRPAGWVRRNIWMARKSMGGVRALMFGDPGFVG